MVGYTRDYQPPTLLTRNILRAHNFPEDVWESLNDNHRLNAVVLDQRVIEKIIEPDRTPFVAMMVLTPEMCSHFEDQSRELREPFEQSWREKRRESDRQIKQVLKRILLETLAGFLLSIGLTFSIAALWPTTDVTALGLVLCIALFGLMFWMMLRMLKAQSRLTPYYQDHFVDFYTAQKQLLLKLWSEQNS